ncbi:MAG: 50S ribosomal protein L32 [Candidatus Omnitrophica bacterium]|nr:50S ribosomal protein L32 [Candidatus Omnitrophota bacterium]
MALPKRRFSRSRSLKKRAHKKLANLKLSICLHCKSKKIPHTICPVCGFYKGKQVIEIKKKEKKEKKR